MHTNAPSKQCPTQLFLPKQRAASVSLASCESVMRTAFINAKTCATMDRRRLVSAVPVCGELPQSQDFRFRRGSLMKVVAPLFATLLVALLASYLYDRPSRANPRTVTVRELLAEPAAYDGQLVTVRTAGFQQGGGPGEIAFHRFWGAPADLVVRYASPYPPHMPVTVTGTFRMSSPPAVEERAARP